MKDAFIAAIQGEYVLQFWYTSASNPTNALRTFSPWEIDDKRSTVFGWDHDRDAMRKFSFDSVLSEPVRYDNEEYARPAS